MFDHRLSIDDIASEVEEESSRFLVCGSKGFMQQVVAALTDSDRWFPGLWKPVFYILTLLLLSFLLLDRIHGVQKNGSGIPARRSVASEANQMVFI